MSVLHIRAPGWGGNHGDAFIWGVKSTFTQDENARNEAASFWMVPGTFNDEGESVL